MSRAVADSSATARMVQRVVHRACALGYGSKNFFCGAPPKRPTA